MATWLGATHSFARATALLLAVPLALVCARVAAQPGAVDGCTDALFLDRTGSSADRTFNWDYSFASDPERCITVRVGQTVTWQGNFGDHPLDADEGDTPNPIAHQVGGVVTFTRAGVFGYRCNFHLAMRGAIRVLPAPAAVPWAGVSIKTTLIALLLVLSAVSSWRAQRLGGLRRALASRTTRRVLPWLEAAALSVLALGLALALGPARYGSPDSATYLSAAEHLARGDGYVTSSLDEHGQFEPLSCFAPLFPLMIALLIKLQQLSPRAAMGEAVGVSFLLYALACYSLLKVLLPPALRRWAFPFSLCLLCLPGSVTCLRSALSDLLGAALALFACAHLLARPEDPGRGRILVSGCLFALAIWARWANLYFALSACAGLVLCARGGVLRQRLADSLTLATSVALLVGPLWLRNLISTGAAMGPRALSASDPLLHVQRVLSGLAQPLLEARAEYQPFPLLSKLYLAMLLVCCAGILALWLSRREAEIDLGLVLALGYIGLLIASSSSTQFDSLDHPRFWLPISPLLLGLALRAQSNAHDLGMHRPLLVLGSCLVAIMTAHAALGVAKQSAHVPASSGVFAQRFARSEVVHTALGLFDDGRCTLFAPHAFWLFPQLGTRPIWWATEVGKRTRAEAKPSCVLLLREHVEFNTDSARFHSYFEQLAHSSRARLLRRDGAAELWWMPPAQALRDGAQHL